MPPHNSPGTSCAVQKISTKFRSWAPNAGGHVKIAFFDRTRSLRLRRLTAENLCPYATVVRVHDDALAEEYAVSLTTLVIVEDCW